MVVGGQLLCNAPLVSAFDRPGLHISSPSTFYPLGSANISHAAKVVKFFLFTKSSKSFAHAHNNFIISSAYGYYRLKILLWPFFVYERIIII